MLNPYATNPNKIAKTKYCICGNDSFKTKAKISDPKPEKIPFKKS